MATAYRAIVLAWLAPAALAGAACTQWHQYALPAPVSPGPVDSAGHPRHLRAGFGRADITPPPGVGLSGNGPEGRMATGWRHHLYARALLLDDERGERLALVVLDLAHVSSNLHRLAADRLVEETGIGADRLILAATHTHAGPGHFYAERQYNESTARLTGYDPAVADLIVTGVVEAVRTASRNLHPAKVAWGFQPLKGYTRNRSYQPYCRNPAAVRVPCARDTLPDGKPVVVVDTAAAVDTLWALLRVDVDEGSGFRPAGAFSVLALHGTANPSVTTLLDGDMHAVIERRLERRIDELNGVAESYATRAVHLFANGTEGDVSPNRGPATQCPVPRLRSPPLTGPRAAAAPWNWTDADSSTLARCGAAARRYVDSAGRILGDSAFAHFTRLGAELRSDVTIARAFTTVLLPGRNGLCSRPFTGTSTAAGAADVPTRVAGWKLLGLVSAGFEQGGKARRKTPRGCHAEKQPLLGEEIQAAVTGEHGFPDVAQLTVARIGDVLLGAIPFEPTTTVGRMWRDSMLAGTAPIGVARAVVVGLANGFAQYVATAPEYAEQFYEGGSTIYGPRTAAVIAGELRLLSESIVRTNPRSPPAWVSPITAYPGAPKEIMPRAESAPRLAGGPKLLEQRCMPDGTLRIIWLDEPPGRLTPSGGPILVLQQDVSGDGKPLAWDDRHDVVVEALGAGKGGYRWQASMPSPVGGAPLRLRLLPRRDFPGKDLEEIKPCS